MAIIGTTTNYFARGSATFELTPNAPTQRELIDTYQMRLWVYDQLVYDEQHSVRNWQMRHFYVSEIARACQCVRQVLDQRISCPAAHDEGYAVESPVLSLVHTKLSTDWLTLLLAAATVKQQELVHMNLYLRKAHATVGDMMRRSRGQWDELIAATIFCTPDEAIGFGTRLQQEIAAVERARISLGIPDYDETDSEE